MVRSLAGWMGFIGILHVIFGALGILAAGCIAFGGLAVLSRHAGVGGLMLVVVAFVFASFAALIWQGILLLDTRKSFRAMALTDDADQMHLSQGFKKLRTFFLVMVIFGALLLLSSAVGLANLLTGGGAS